MRVGIVTDAADANGEAMRTRAGVANASENEACALIILFHDCGARVAASGEGAPGLKRGPDFSPSPSFFGREALMRRGGSSSRTPGHFFPYFCSDPDPILARPNRVRTTCVECLLIARLKQRTRTGTFVVDATCIDRSAIGVSMFAAAPPL